MNDTKNTHPPTDTHDNDIFILNQNGSITQLEPIAQNETGLNQIKQIKQQENIKTNN